MTLVKRLTEAWRSYWFGWSAPLSLEILRIAIAIGTLHAWNQVAAASYADLLATYPDGAYQPLGLLRLLGDDPPPVWFLEAAKVAALAGALFMLVGLATRVSLVVTALSMFVVVGMSESFVKSWHHSFTPLLVAHLAFMFAPAGRRLSLDALIAPRLRRRGWLKGDPPPDAPVWPVLLVQVAAGLFFFNAAYWKLRDGGMSWVFSDSLRHHILASFDWAARERTALADFLVHHEVAWKAAAATNLLTQAAPLAACFFVRRPLIRAALGLFFIAETVLLDVVMNLPNYQWLPLVVVFVDWDRLVPWVERWLARRRGSPPPDATLAAPAAMSPRTRVVVSLYIAVFLLLNLIVAFGPRRADIKWNLYPLSQYRMFSQTRAKPPYDQHQTWEYESIRFSADRMKRGPQKAELERFLNKRFRRRWGARDQALVERILAEAIATRRIPRDALTAHYSILVAPAHPAEPDLVEHRIGILGRMRGDRFESLLGRADTDESGRYFIEPRPTGVELPPDARISYILDNDPSERDLAVERQGSRLYYQPAAPGLHTFIAHVGNKRFILAEARHGPD